MKLINSAYIFSLYPNLLTVDHAEKDIDINQLYEIVKYGYVRKIIESLRSSPTKEEYNRIKREELPCVTLSGTFGYRASTGLVAYSGLMQVDIDQVDNYNHLFAELCHDDIIYVSFRSPGGKGIKAIVKVDANPDIHKIAFSNIENFFKVRYGVKIDNQCKDIARTMLLSYDPDIYCNPFSRLFTTNFPKEKTQNKKQDKPYVINKVKIAHTRNDQEVIEELIKELERRHIDITSSYENWTKVGFALCATFGEIGRNYYHRIGGMYKGYTLEETDKMYSQLLRSDKGKIKLGTILFLAKEKGIKI